MKLIRTAKIKLNLSVAEILPTVQLYTKAFNYVCKVGFKANEKNSIELHKKTYQEVRKYLPSQLAISSRMKAAEALKSVFTKKKKYTSCPQSDLCSIRYDKNSYSISFKKKQISLLTINGRKKCELNIPTYYQDLFDNWAYTAADLCIKKNTVYLHIVFETWIPDTKSNGNVIGIDRGITNIAVTSNNKFFGGKIVKKIVNKRQRLRNKLQQKGTRSAKRHLKRLSGKEKRFRADINHQISKQIINSLNPGDTIVLEDLTGIRNKRLRKKQRTLINGWSFFQLEQFLIYKAEAAGIRVEHVNAAYTSQKCSCCGFTSKKNRQKQADFICKKCGFKLHADLNGSRNIAAKYSNSYMLLNKAVVNQPIVSSLLTDTSHQPCADGN